MAIHEAVPAGYYNDAYKPREVFTNLGPTHPEYYRRSAWYRDLLYSEKTGDPEVLNNLTFRELGCLEWEKARREKGNWPTGKSPYDELTNEEVALYVVEQVRKDADKALQAAAAAVQEERGRQAKDRPSISINFQYQANKQGRFVRLEDNGSPAVSIGERQLSGVLHLNFRTTSESVLTPVERRIDRAL
jgi:hypothetical protein